MTRARTDESPTGGTWTGGALGRGKSGLDRCSCVLGRLTGIAENRIPQECPECIPAFLVGIHRRKGVKFKGQNDSHQKIPGRHTLTVTQIGRVRVRDVNTFRKFLVSHSGHDCKYGVYLTRRQRVVRHEA